MNSPFSQVTWVTVALKNIPVCRLSVVSALRSEELSEQKPIVSIEGTVTNITANSSKKRHTLILG